MRDLKTELKELIEEGKSIKHENTYNLGGPHEYIKGKEYERWISKCTIILKKYFSSHPLIDKFTTASERAVGNGTDYFDTMIGVLEAIKDNLETKFEEDPFAGEKLKKLFISHSSKDKEYVEALVQLLNNIGIPKSNDYIFCSSFEGYNIPLGENIYDYIKKQFNQNIMVLCILSKNYYNSIPCLNEMGATWVTSRKYHSILLPNFQFSNIEGAIDPTKMGFKINDKDKLNTFKNEIIDLFNLKEIDISIWEKDRNKFLEKIHELESRDQYTNDLTKVDIERIKKQKNDKIEIDLRFINKGDVPVEFQELHIELIDDDRNILEFEVKKEYLEQFVIYGDENRREVLIIENTNENYKPHRNAKWKTKSFTVNAY